MTAREPLSTEPALNPGAPSRPVGWRILWIVSGAVVTYALFMVIALNKPDGLRGARVGGTYFDVRANDTPLDLAIVGILGAVVGLLMLVRGRLRLAWEFLIGQWLALLAAVIVILFS